MKPILVRALAVLSAILIAIVIVSDALLPRGVLSRHLEEPDGVRPVMHFVDETECDNRSPERCAARSGDRALTFGRARADNDVLRPRCLLQVRRLLSGQALD